MSTIGLVGCINEPPPTIWEGDVYHYRITAFDLPDTSEDVRAMAVNLDEGEEDTEGDNAIGAAYRALRGAYPSFQVEAAAATRLEQDLGLVLTLWDVGSDGAAARVALGYFEDTLLHPPLPDLTPPIDEARGDGLGAGFVLRGGSATVPMGVISDPTGTAEPAWLLSTTTAIRVDAWDDAAATITLGVGLWHEQVTSVVYPNLAAYFTSKLPEADANFARLLDSDDDGTVTVDEIAASELIASLFEPDLDDFALSFGLRLQAEAL